MLENSHSTCMLMVKTKFVVQSQARGTAVRFWGFRAPFGAWGTLAQYGIAYHEIFPRPGTKIPETRYVAIGASFLNGSTSSVPPDENGKSLSDQERINYLAAYRDLKPEAVIGDAVYVFRVK